MLEDGGGGEERRGGEKKSLGRKTVTKTVKPAFKSESKRKTTEMIEMRRTGLWALPATMQPATAPNLLPEWGTH